MTYREIDGIFYPDVEIPETTHYPIGKYGELHRRFLKEHRKGTYTTLFTQCRLNEYLHEIDVQAREVVRSIIDRFAEERGINEALKAENALLWVQEMNNCKAAAEEIVMREIVYR